MDFPLLCSFMQSCKNSWHYFSCLLSYSVNYWVVLSSLNSVVLTGNREFCETGMKCCVCHMLLSLLTGEIKSHIGVYWGKIPLPVSGWGEGNQLWCM